MSETEQELVQAQPANSKEPSAVAVPAESGDMAQMMRIALDRGEDGIAFLERLAPLYQNERDEAARRAFYRDFNRVQSEMGPAVKNATNEHQGSTYANLTAVTLALRPVYTRHGFSMLFGESQGAPEGCVRMTVDVMHREGHMVQRSMDVPLDTGGKKTATHAKGSTISYCERYLTCAIWTPEIVEKDNDGNGSGNKAEPQPISSQTIEDIGALYHRLEELRGSDVDRKPMLDWCKIDRIEDATTTLGKRIVQALEKKIAEEST